MKSETIGALAAALSKAQSEMQAAEPNQKNNHLGNKYADLGSIIEAVRQPLAKNGLSFTQLLTSEAGMVGMETILLHTSGEWVSTCMQLPFGDMKGLSLVQSAGVLVTYLRRYQLAALIGVYAGDDDDGNDKSKPAAKSEPAPVEKPSSEMSFETAAAVTTSKGDKYGEMDSRTLAAVLRGINKAIADETDEMRIAELKYKKDAALTVLNSG